MEDRVTGIPLDLKRCLLQLRWNPFCLKIICSTMGAVSRYPYPKEVWSPAGGWWAQPKTWKANTAVAALGMAVTIGFIWSVSAEKEVRYQQPKRWIPSMMWAKQYKDQQ